MTRKVYDALHKFISFDLVEEQLLKARPLYRLQGIRQLGCAFFVYPEAHHTRYSHALGTMHIASLIYDQVTLGDQDDIVPKPGSEEHTYWRRILRLAALCHDVGHLPCSHTAESSVLGSDSHEDWTHKIINSEYIASIISQAGQRAVEDVVKIALGPHKSEASYTPWEGVVTQMLTGDFFGADRCDYLLRDAYFTGLVYGSIDYLQLISMLRVLPYEGKLSLGIDEKGIESSEALLLARYFMHKRLYQYKSVKACSFHCARYLKKFFSRSRYLDSVDSYLLVNDHDVYAALYQEIDRDGDAKALVDKNHRYIAHALSEQEFCRLTEEKEKFDMDQIEFEPCLSVSKQEFVFPVLTKLGKIVPAETISLVFVPQISGNWVYVSPKYQQEFFTRLHR